MNAIEDLKLGTVKLLARHKSEMSRTLIVVDETFGVGSILAIFDAQRRDLERKVWGSSGAFTGFTRLSTRPLALGDVEYGAEIEVKTTVRPYLDCRLVVEVTARTAGDRSGDLVEGVGVSVRIT